jgi:hypothetical protein
MKNNPFKIQEGQVKDSKVKDFFVDKKVGDYLNFEFVSRSQNLGKIVSDEKIKNFDCFLCFYWYFIYQCLLFASGQGHIIGTLLRAIESGQISSLPIVDLFMIVLVIYWSGIYHIFSCM